MKKLKRRSHQVKGRQLLKRNLICFQIVQKLLQPMQSQKQMNLKTQKYLPLLFMLMKSQSWINATEE